SSNYITKAELPNIMLGKSPERDREIDDVCQMIRNSARAGIPTLKYNLTFLGVVRTESTRGRGGAEYSTFVYDKAKQEPPLTEAGPVDADRYWERITYFLERVVPVAEEYKGRLACHPQDPGMPRGRGFRGVETVLGSVDGLKRFVSIKESAYHGLNFCQGTVSEMLQKPGQEIFDVIRYFGSRKKIFNVHFRNIRGGVLNFQETSIDDGDVDMLKSMRVYKEVGFDGMRMPDQVPRIEGDAHRFRGFALPPGYIKALTAAVSARGRSPLRPRAGHRQPAASSVVGNSIHYEMQRLCGKRRHARFQFRQIDPAGDLTGIRLNDCDSILRQNVGVDLAVDELELIQIFDTLVAVEHYETAQLGESLGIQESQFRGAVAHDEPVIVMSEAPSFAWVHESRPWLERRNVVGHADVVSKVSSDVLEKFTQVPWRLTSPP